MKKTVAFVLVLILAMSCLSMFSAASADQTLWVKTPNGKTVNGRDRNSEVITRLPYGTKVTMYDEEDYWAICRGPGFSEGWIMETFLVDYNPGKYQGADAGTSGSKSGTSQKKTTVSDSALGSQTVDGLNSQYKTFTYLATPYTVKVVPDTKTGTARLRWGPSKFATLVTYLESGHQLTVLASNKSWLMVRDDASGKIGYIAVKYTAPVQ